MLGAGQTILAATQTIHVPTSTLTISDNAMAPGKPKDEPQRTGLSLSEATDFTAVERAHEHRSAAPGDPALLEPNQLTN